MKGGGVHGYILIDRGEAGQGCARRRHAARVVQRQRAHPCGREWFSPCERSYRRVGLPRLPADLRGACRVGRGPDAAAARVHRSPWRRARSRPLSCLRRSRGAKGDRGRAHQREKQSSPVRHESETKRAAWVEARIRALTTGGMPNAEARKAARLGAKAIAAGVKGTLTGSLTFETDDGRIIPIADILLDPQAHAGLTGPDPQEGRSYGGESRSYCSATTGALSFSRSHTARASIGSCTIALRSREVFGQAISDRTPISLRRWSMGSR